MSTSAAGRSVRTSGPEVKPDDQFTKQPRRVSRSQRPPHSENASIARFPVFPRSLVGPVSWVRRRCASVAGRGGSSGLWAGARRRDPSQHDERPGDPAAGAELPGAVRQAGGPSAPMPTFRPLFRASRGVMDRYTAPIQGFAPAFRDNYRRRGPLSPPENGRRPFAGAPGTPEREPLCAPAPGLVRGLSWPGGSAVHVGGGGDRGLLRPLGLRDAISAAPAATCALGGYRAPPGAGLPWGRARKRMFVQKP